MTPVVFEYNIIYAINVFRVGSGSMDSSVGQDDKSKTNSIRQKQNALPSAAVQSTALAAKLACSFNMPYLILILFSVVIFNHQTIISFPPSLRPRSQFTPHPYMSSRKLLLIDLKQFNVILYNSIVILYMFNRIILQSIIAIEKI